ncbi:MAG TPA: sulfatase-like hydrolase/transferase [Thermoanaerobaculia bacterium]|nr:sulfatase-like hydrolase/transferase [Thermoanaerobaculia bacterium]
MRYLEGAPAGNLQRDGKETANILLAHRSPATDHQFLFLHLFEPHAPYEPSYDGEIVKADAILGRFLDSLGTTYDDALVVLLSDHGEGLREHGEQEHGVLLYREALQVPLIVKLPRAKQRGTRVADPVGLIDVLPTITSYLELPTKGTPLLAKHTPRALYAESLYPRIHLGWSELFSIIRYPFHLIDGPRPELYRVDNEQHPLDERRRLIALERDLAAIPHAATIAPHVDAEEAKKLEALGYVSAGATQHSNLNPRDHLGDLDALKHVTELMAAHKPADAAKEIEALLARNPGWSDLRNDLGLAYEQLGDLANAERAYREAIRATPELAPEFALSLASVLVSEGRVDEAEAHARIALSSNPGGAHMLLALCALRRHDEPHALDEARVASAYPSSELAARFLTAQLLGARGEIGAALAELTRVDGIARARNVPLPRGFTETREAFLRQYAP